MITKEAILDVINQPPAVYLATVEGSSPRICALENLRCAKRYPRQSVFCRAAGFVFYLSTSKSSRKITAIEGNPEVSLYFCDADKYRSAMFSGKAEVLNDQVLREALWDDSWRIYWPSGVWDEDYVLVRLAPSNVMGWWGSQSYEVELTMI